MLSQDYKIKVTAVRFVNVWMKAKGKDDFSAWLILDVLNISLILFDVWGTTSGWPFVVGIYNSNLRKTPKLLALRRRIFWSEWKCLVSDSVMQDP